MKQNKKLVYVLLPLSIVIWGFIIYQIMQRLDGDDDKVMLDPSTKRFVKTSFLEKDTAKLLLNYPDPFLKKGARKKESSFTAVPFQPYNVAPKLPNLNKPALKVDTKVVIAWPKIFYSGVIENQQKKLKVAMIQIAGQDHLLKEKDSKNGVQLLKIFKDSVQLLFQGQVRFQKRGQ